MLVWIVVGVVLGVSGIGVLAAFTFRLWRQVRRLGHDVSTAAERISRAADELARIAPPRR